MQPEIQLRRDEKPTLFRPPPSLFSLRHFVWVVLYFHFRFPILRLDSLLGMETVLVGKEGTDVLENNKQSLLRIHAGPGKKKGGKQTRRRKGTKRYQHLLDSGEDRVWGGTLILLTYLPFNKKAEIFIQSSPFILFNIVEMRHSL